MKVIDLLNKIAKGEEVPKKIEYRGYIYNFDVDGYLHYETNNTREHCFLEGLRTDKVLNEEVKIQEDKTEEIEELGKSNSYAEQILDNRNKLIMKLKIIFIIT